MATVPKELFDKKQALETVLKLYEVTNRRWDGTGNMVSDLIANARELTKYLEENQ